MYPQELPFVLRPRVCGTVEAVGDGVTAPRLGDWVTTADAVGAYAEYCVAPVDVVTSVPDGVTSDIAAAAILKRMTAHFLVKSVYPVQLRDTVLLQEGAGGVGLILTQWGDQPGGRVISTACAAHKAALSRRAGAVEVLDYPDDPQQFGAKVGELTGGNGVAAVHDGVGKSTFDASLASLAILGNVVMFGAASRPVPPLDPQRLNAAGSVFLPRPSAPFHANPRRVYLAYRRIV